MEAIGGHRKCHIFMIFRNILDVLPTRVGIGNGYRATIMFGVFLLEDKFRYRFFERFSAPVAGLEKNHLVAMVMMRQNSMRGQHQDGEKKKNKGYSAFHHYQVLSCRSCRQNHQLAKIVFFSCNPVAYRAFLQQGLPADKKNIFSGKGEF